MAKWTHAVEMKFEIEFLDGTRIGGTSGGLEIGGVDLMPLKDPVSGEPYVPGSSLKGKLRSTLEKRDGKSSDGNPCHCGDPTCSVCPVFGAHMNSGAKCGMPRLTVRDAHFTKTYRSIWKQNPILEMKVENTVNRVTGVAKNLRTQERVPAGAMFEAAMVLKVFEGDDDAQMVANLKNALAILQQCDSLGAGGSRGSGRIAIRNFRQEKVAIASLTL